MRKVLAVALLDWKRLGFGLTSGALVAGLIPTLASGLGVKVEPSSVLLVALGIVGVAAGEFFGGDFAEGKSSYYFARPLPTASFFAGRLISVLTLAAGALAAFMTSFTLSSSEGSPTDLSILPRTHGAALAGGWCVALYFRLAVAVSSKNVRSPKPWLELAKAPFRLAFSLGSVIFVFGLFGDLMLRAYRGPNAMKLLVGSWVVACLIASLVGIAQGRTEGLRIARFQRLVGFAHAGLAALAVIAAWVYVLHPGPGAIREVRFATGSPDGRFAYVQTTVDRGTPEHFLPVFVVDLASGQTTRLNSDPIMGPWTSLDGSTLAWGEATPLFLRPIWRMLGGASNLRVKGPSGSVESLLLPSHLDTSGVPGTDGYLFTGGVDAIVPSADGALLALVSWGSVTFMERSGALLKEATLAKYPARLKGLMFTPTGKLRAARGIQEGATARIEFMEVDPRTGNINALSSIETGSSSSVRFDAQGGRALVTSGGPAGASMTLVNLGEGPAPSNAGVALGSDLFSGATFLADGRVAVAGGDAYGRTGRSLRVFSSTGEPTLNQKLDDGANVSLGKEVFPGVLCLHILKGKNSAVAFIDATNGAELRRIPGYSLAPRPFSLYVETVPPPGTPGARLLLSAGKLYELPSLQAEPRLLLPKAPGA